MSEQYPYKPPQDASEWTCPECGCDVLWCGHFREPAKMIGNDGNRQTVFARLRKWWVKLR